MFLLAEKSNKKADEIERFLKDFFVEKYVDTLYMYIKIILIKLPYKIIIIVSL